MPSPCRGQSKDQRVNNYAKMSAYCAGYLRNKRGTGESHELGLHLRQLWLARQSLRKKSSRSRNPAIQVCLHAVASSARFCEPACAMRPITDGLRQCQRLARNTPFSRSGSGEVETQNTARLECLDARGGNALRATAGSRQSEFARRLPFAPASPPRGGLCRPQSDVSRRRMVLATTAGNARFSSQSCAACESRSSGRASFR